jgi:hypothetical protein
MKYFEHSTNSFSDEAITELYMSFGYEGLGLFYTVLEKLAMQERPMKTHVLKEQVHVGKKLEKCWKFMEEIGLLLTKDGETFNENILKNCGSYSIKKEKNAKKISEWREKQSLTKSVTGYEHNSNLLEEKRREENRIEEENTSPAEPVTSHIDNYFLELKNKIDGTKVVSKFQTQMSEKEFFALRENYSFDQIIEVIEIMENSKSSKGKTSVYLTALNICKKNFGVDEVAKAYNKFLSRYKVFVTSVTSGEVSEPNIDRYEKEAMIALISMLKDNSKAKTIDAAYANFEWICASWNLIDTFMQKRMKLQEILKDYSKIIKAIQDAKAASKPSGNSISNQNKLTSRETID